MDITQFQYVTGLEGSFNDDLDWDIFLNQGWRSRNDMDVGQLSGPALQNALGPSAVLSGDGAPECYTNINDPSSLIVGCVPLNVFGGGSVDRPTGIVTGTSVTQDMLEYVSAPLTDWYETKQTIWGANLTGSMSTNTGLMPFQSSACAVATKEYGVVITSPVMRSACSAVTSPSVPFANSAMCRTPRNSHSVNFDASTSTVPDHCRMSFPSVKGSAPRNSISRTQSYASNRSPRSRKAK